MEPFLPTEDTDIDRNTVQEYLGKRCYVDLGDSIVSGGEFTALLVDTQDDEYLVFEDHHGRFYQPMGSIVHLSPVDTEP